MQGMILVMGACAHFVMVSKIQWKPIWFIAQLCPQMTGLGGILVWSRTMTHWHRPHCYCMERKELHSRFNHSVGRLLIEAEQGENRKRRFQYQYNRPIVLLQPGHEVRGIPAVRSCKKRCFCTFLRHSLGLAWLWTTVFFFQLAWKTQSMFDDVLVQRWHWKKSRLEWFSPFSLRESPVSCNRSGSSWPDLRKGDIHDEQSILRWRKNASLDNKELEWSDERLS